MAHRISIVENQLDMCLLDFGDQPVDGEHELLRLGYGQSVRRLRACAASTPLPLARAQHCASQEPRCARRPTLPACLARQSAASNSSSASRVGTPSFMLRCSIAPRSPREMPQSVAMFERGTQQSVCALARSRNDALLSGRARRPAARLGTGPRLAPPPRTLLSVARSMHPENILRRTTSARPPARFEVQPSAIHGRGSLRSLTSRPV